MSVGITIEPCDPERHVRLIELATGYLKQTFKCICAGLTYKLPTKLYKLEVLDAAAKINLCPNKSNGWLSPWQLFAIKDLCHTFGELVKFFRKPKYGAATDEPTEHNGIMLGKRESSRSGALLVYDIEKDVVLAANIGVRFLKQQVRKIQIC